MTYLTQKLNSVFHNGGEAICISLDISKAFDRVWHTALPSKCKAIGITGKLLDWIGNFLSNRSIQVLVDGFISEQVFINAGVPQGCVLSTTLFIIFINDLLSVTENPVHSYADDSTLTASYEFPKKTLATSQLVVSKRTQVSTSINSDLSKISEWGQQNRVNFNASKTQCCLISRKIDAKTVDLQINFQGQILDRSLNLNILGTELHYKLLWGDHVFHIAKKAARMLGFLSRCRAFFTPSDLLKIYKAYIGPKMEVNSHIWAGAPPTILTYLDSVQNRAIRLINNN